MPNAERRAEIASPSLVLPTLLLSLSAAPLRTQSRQSAPDEALFRTIASLDGELSLPTTRATSKSSRRSS
jgi:hypothetical protein